MDEAHVEAIYISPVKSLALQRVERVKLGPKGIAEDRRFFLADERGKLVSQRECGALVQVHATYTIEPERLRLVFPDGSAVEDGVRTEAETSAKFFGTRDVRAFELDGPWSEAVSHFAGTKLRLLKAASTAFDNASVSLLSMASVAELQRHMPTSSIDERRFRPNFYISGVDPHGEDEWLDRSVSIGAATVRVRMRDERCVMTTHNPDTGDQDADTLKAIASYRPDQPKEVNFGVYASVETPGAVAVGNAVAPH